LTASDHVCSPLARLALAAGGVGVLAALAFAADAVAALAGGARGMLAGVLLIGTVFTSCWIVHRARPALHPVPRSGKFPGITPRPGTAAVIWPLPRGRGAALPRGAAPRPTGADPSGARDFTTAGRRFPSC